MSAKKRKLQRKARTLKAHHGVKPNLHKKRRRL